MEESIVLILFIVLPLVMGTLLWFFFMKTGRTQKRRRRKLVTGNALVLLFLLSFVLPAGEIYYRFFYDSTDAFGLTKVSRRWFERHYRFNNTEVRDSIDYRKQRSGKRRVTFIGDSFVAGHGITDVEERFANRIRRMRRDLDVHVYATNGYDTSHEMKLLQELYNTGYEFNTVILVYILNDISDLVPEWGEILERLYRDDGPGFLFEHSYFLNTLYYRRLAARDPDVANYFRFVREAYDGPHWNVQQRRLATVKRWMDTNGITFLVVTFPFLHTIGPDNEYREIHTRLDTFWRSLGVPHLDLLPLFEPYAPSELMVGMHDAHPNERAHRLAAGAISRFLEANMPESSTHTAP